MTTVIYHCLTMVLTVVFFDHQLDQAWDNCLLSNGPECLTAAQGGQSAATVEQGWRRNDLGQSP